MTGCGHAYPRGAAQLRNENESKASQISGKRPAKASRPPKITPVSEPSGRVVMVNSDSRFVIVDFFLSQLPKTDQRLGVYRQGQKVGEVKISGSNLGGVIPSEIVAADMMEGDAKVGDEIRPE